MEQYEPARDRSREAHGLLEKNDYQGALDSFVSALDLLPENRHVARARILCNIGHIQVRLQQYQEANASFHTAHDLFIKGDDRIAAGEQLGNMGSVYRDTENWDAALAQYLDALSIFGKEGHRPGIADQFSNIAYILARQGKLQDAMLNFTKAQAIFADLGDERKADLCNQNLLALKPRVTLEPETMLCASTCCGHRKSPQCA
ncbi:MAG: tetratricopeptide repeat protein [Desulfuromonadales bacterium]|nr:tetratricopeptide repeat protein [Desulfuromonadales bacterium]